MKERSEQSPSLTLLPGGLAPPEPFSLPPGFILCAAMPDEPAQAHAARMARLNECPSGSAMAEVIRRSANWPSQETAEILLRVLARASESSVDTYCQKHSMYPFRRIVTLSNEEKYFEAQRKNFLHPRYQAHEKPRICARCVSADISWRGFSWYRRRHDIPGIDCCIVHGCPLREVEGDNPYARLPHEVLANGESKLVQTREQNFSNAPHFVRKYAQAFMALGNAGKPISKNSVAVVLAQRSAQVVGGASTHRMTRMVSRQTLDSKAPIDWLRRLADERELSSGMAAIQTKHEVGNEYVALAIAALFGSVDDAICEFQRTQTSPALLAFQDKRLRNMKRYIHDPAWLSYCRNASWLGDLVSESSSRGVEGVEWEVMSKLPELETSSAWRALETFCSGKSLRDACAMRIADVAVIEKFLRVEVREFCRFVRKLQTLSGTHRPRDKQGPQVVRRTGRRL